VSDSLGLCAIVGEKSTVHMPRHIQMSRLLHCRLSTCISDPIVASLYELASLLTAGRFHRSIDLYHTLATTLTAGDSRAVQRDPWPRDLLYEAASMLVVASACLGHPDDALRLLSLLADGGPGDGTHALLPVHPV
jgi:hypothetical protein